MFLIWILPKAIYRVNAIPIKRTPAFFTELEQVILTFLDFKSYYKAVIIKTVWYQHKYRHTEPGDRRENSEMDPQIYGQISFDNTWKIIQWKKDGLFGKWGWKNWTETCGRMNLENVLTPYTKINSKWMKDLNVGQETIKILQEKTGGNLFDLGRSNFLLHMSPEANMNHWDLIKMKSFNKQQTQRQSKRWEKIFTNNISDKESVFNMYKTTLIKLKTQHPRSKWSRKELGKRQKQTLLQRRHPDGNRHTKTCSTSFIIREKESKTTMRYHSYLSEWLKWITDGEDVEKGDHFGTFAGRNANWCSHSGKQCGSSSRNLEKSYPTIRQWHY